MWRRLIPSHQLLNINNVNYVSKIKKGDCMPKPECKPTISKPCQTFPCEPKVDSVMDLVPYPEGCWRDMYERNNQKYNLILVFGIVNFVTAFVCQLKVGFVPGYPEVSVFERLFECFEQKKK